MASQTLGNIGTTHLTLSTRVDDASVSSSMNQIESKIAASTREISVAQQTALARNAATQFAGAYGRAGTRIQEVGRGLEDFIVSFSMAKTTAEGIALGLRGSANNAAQLAASFNPLAGAAVAIGASLATVVVPMMGRWMEETSKVKEEMKRVEEQAKSLQERMLFKIRLETVGGGSDPEATLKDMKREADVARRVSQFEAKQVAATKDEIRREEERKEMGWMNRVAKLKETLAEQEKRRADAAAKADDQVRRTAMFDEITKNERREKRIEETEKKRKKEGRESRLDEMQQEEEFNKWVAEQKEQARQKDVKALDEEYKFMKEAEERNLEAQIDARTESIDKLQERIQKSGNAAGPSAALMSGTQAAESIISRALTGSRSVEDTMKAQLKVEQDQLKELRRIQTRKTATI